MTSPAGFDEPHSFLIALTTPDNTVVAAIDLHYELAIEPDVTLPATEYTTAGIYIDSQPVGARVAVDDGTTSAAFYLNADECVRTSHYLLACAKAAVDRNAGQS